MAHKSNVIQVLEKLEGKTQQETVTDPVCKTKMKRKDCKHTIYLADKTYHFCSKGCRDKFSHHRFTADYPASKAN